MADYSVQKESAHILLNNLLKDDRIGWTPELKEAAKKVKFVGDSKPFIPTPLKVTESASSLFGLLGALAATVAEERYGVKQDVTVNTDKASLFLLSFLWLTIDGESVHMSKKVADALAEMDHGNLRKPIRQQASNIYQCKDKKWYHLHGSMDARKTMEMMGVPEQDVSHEEAQAIYTEKVAQWDSAEIERTANDDYKQAGCVCNTPEEFFAHPHEKEPLATLEPVQAVRKPWPKVSGSDYRPLAGIRVVDHTRAIAGPTVSKLLAVLGADVVKITYKGIPDTGPCYVDINAGKRDVDLNLKSEEGKATLMEIIRDADVFIDGYRPHTIEKLGFDAETLRKSNPSLIYVRENCYGWKGSLSYRSGWQQIADCFSGHSWMQGKFLGLNEPVVPLLPNSDYQTGIIGAIWVTHALQQRARANVTFNVDIALVQYCIWYYKLGQYTEEQNKALLARNPSFKVRHFDEMGSMFEKMPLALAESRPGLVQTPEFYTKMSGKNWGEPDMHILDAPFELSRSKPVVPLASGPRGWANNNYEWFPIA